MIERFMDVAIFHILLHLKNCLLVTVITVCYHLLFGCMEKPRFSGFSFNAYFKTSNICIMWKL